MTDTGFPEMGDVIEYTLPRIGLHPKKLTYRGTVARTEPAEDGWEAGIVVDYPEVKFRRKKGCAVFHEWPHRYARVIAEATP